MQTVTGIETVALASGSSDRGVAPAITRMVEMLVFDDEFKLTGRRKLCTLWANEPKFKRVCFTINTDILPDGRKAVSGIHDFGELQLCEGERPYIEAACRRAFANRPNSDIELQPSDFAQPIGIRPR